MLSKAVALPMTRRCLGRRNSLPPPSIGDASISAGGGEPPPADTPRGGAVRPRGGVAGLSAASHPTVALKGPLGGHPPCWRTPSRDKTAATTGHLPTWIIGTSGRNFGSETPF